MPGRETGTESSKGGMLCGHVQNELKQLEDTGLASVLSVAPYPTHAGSAASPSAWVAEALVNGS